MRWTSDTIAFIVALVLLTSCEKAIDPEVAKKNDDGNVEVEFRGYGSAAKVALMAFNTDGSRALTKVKTGVPTEPLLLSLPVGDYVLVAVAHSSDVTPTLKSPQQVQFNARDGRKLTDTYCLAMPYTVEHDQPVSVEMPLRHASACVLFSFTDDLPEGTTALRFDYNGGSANVNPSTLEGYTKSTQTELRPVVQPQEYAIYTFPYMAATGTLNVTVHYLDATGADVYQRLLTNVPVTRGKVTTVSGDLQTTSTSMGFTVGDWNGETTINF